MRREVQRTLGGLAISIGLVCIICSQGLAAQFKWYNDPNSTTDFTLFSRSCAQTASTPCTTNSIRLADIQAVNLIDRPLSDVGFYLAATWPRIFNPDGSLTSFALAWRNDLDGWYTGNFDSSGTSLLVTATLDTPNNTPNARLAAGSVAADQTLTQPLQDLTNLFVFDGLPEVPAPGDLMPFVDLGSLQPLGAKSVDIVLTYHWGDDRPCCALRTAFTAFTLAPVPEPSAIVLLGMGLIVFLGWRWRYRV